MNKKMLIAIIVVAVLGLGGVFGYPMIKQAMLESNPVNHILYSGVQTNDEKAVDATVTLAFGLDEAKMIETGAFDGSEDPAAMAKFVNTLVSRVELDYDVLTRMDYDTNDLQVVAGMSLNYKDIPALEMNANFKPWEASLELPQVVNGPLYLNIQEVLDASGSEIQLKDVDLAAYLKAIYEEDAAYTAIMNNSSAYETVFRNLLEGEGKVEKLGKSTITVETNGVTSEVPVVQYKLNVTMDDIYGMYIELIKVAKTDENVKAFALDRINKIETLVITNEDYAMFGVSKEEVEAGFAEMKTELTDNWETALDEAATEISSQRIQLEELGMSQSLSNMVLSIDKQNIMRQVSLDIVTEGILMTETVTYNAFGDDVVIPAMPTKEEARDLFAIMNDEIKVSTLQEEVLTNLSSKLLAGEAVTALLSDVKTDVEVLPEAEREMMVQQFEESVSGMQMMLPFMLSGMGM
jgi:hypothetical protein